MRTYSTKSAIATALPGESVLEFGSSPEPEPEIDVLVAEETETRVDSPWIVILYNDHIHTFDDVIIQLIKATGCSTGDAEGLAWQVHTQGKANVFEGSIEKCVWVQSVLREIELVTEING